MTNSTPESIIIAMIHGYTTVIDTIDSDLAGLHWSYKTTPEGHIYAKRDVTEIPQIKGRQKRKRREISLHRTILERIIGRRLQTGEMCDHINGDTLDNRRANLRVASSAQNNQNCKMHIDNSSGYKGVYWEKRVRRWRADIQANGERRFLGLYATAVEASEAYQRAALELHGEFARSD